MERIEGFTGDYRFLSNFFRSGMKAQYPGILGYGSSSFLFPTVEHAYQSSRSEDAKTRERIRNLLTPSEAKRAGRAARQRRDWNDIRVKVMKHFVEEKFRQNPKLVVLLLKTGEAILIEANAWHDSFWGVSEGKGENNLGKILMDVREGLKDSVRLSRADQK